MVERRIHHEYKEPLNNADAHRIAGALEIAGSAGFHLDVREEVASPFCQMTEKRYEIVEGLKRLYGGWTKARGKSWQWLVSGRDAARIGEACIDIAPSRCEMFGLFSDWNESESHMRRYELAKTLPVSYRTPTTEAEYLDLLQNPYFFAGVFDARGTSTTSKKVRDNGTLVSEAAITIATTNLQLLSALKRMLGGSVQIRGGDKSFGRSINLVVASKGSIAKIVEHRSTFGVLAGSNPSDVQYDIPQE